MYTAICMSNSDRSKDGFATEDEAIQYVVDNHICPDCVEDGWGSSCAAEWEVSETEKLQECDDFGDVLVAAGYTEGIE